MWPSVRNARIISKKINWWFVNPSGCFSDVKVDEKTIPDTSYDPSKSKYHPVNDACWKHGEWFVTAFLSLTTSLLQNLKLRLLRLLEMGIKSTFFTEHNLSEHRNSKDFKVFSVHFFVMPMSFVTLLSLPYSNHFLLLIEIWAFFKKTTFIQSSGLWFSSNYL